MSTELPPARRRPAILDPGARGWGDVLEAAFRARALVFLLLLIAAITALEPGFFSAGNVAILSSHVAINAIMAIGVTFTILVGGIDLSVGSIAGLAGMVAGGLLVNGLVLEPLGVAVYFAPALVVVIALAVGVGVGLVNGWVSTRLGVAPFIATLGMLYVARGAALIFSDSATYPNLDRNRFGPTGFDVLGIASPLGIPMPVWLMAALALVAIFLTRATPFGRHLYAIGGNERAAQLAGIRVGRVKVAAYVLSGGCAALAGLVVASQLDAAYPNTGQGYELNAIAAVVLGGASLSGGKGAIVGTVIGAFLIGVLNDGLVFLGVSSIWQMVVKGAVIVGAVALDQLEDRMTKRRSVRRKEAEIGRPQLEEEMPGQSRPAP